MAATLTLRMSLLLTVNGAPVPTRWLRIRFWVLRTVARLVRLPVELSVETVGA